MFVGAVVAVLVGGWLSDRGHAPGVSTAATDAALVLLAFAGAAAADGGALHYAFAVRLSFASALSAVLVGVVSVAFSTGYAAAVTLLAGSVDGEVPALDPTSRAETWIFAVVMAPVAEELLCRGAVWRALERLTPGRSTEILITAAALFALLHGLNGAFLFEFPHRFVAGAAFGWLRLRYGSIAPSVIAHAVHNAVAVALGG